MDSMTSSCVNGALCCPTRGREGKICRRIYDAQNPGCPKQFRPCRQVQLLIVSLVLHLFLHCYSCFADSLSHSVARKDVTRLSTAQIVSEMVEVLRTGHGVNHL